MEAIQLMLSPPHADNDGSGGRREAEPAATAAESAEEEQGRFGSFLCAGGVDDEGSSEGRSPNGDDASAGRAPTVPVGDGDTTAAASHAQIIAPDDAITAPDDTITATTTTEGGALVQVLRPFLPTASVSLIRAPAEGGFDGEWYGSACGVDGCLYCVPWGAS